MMRTIRLDEGKHGVGMETRPMSAEELGATIIAMEGLILPRGVAVQINAIQADRIACEPARYIYVAYMFFGAHHVTGIGTTFDLGINDPPSPHDIAAVNRALIMAYVED